MTDARSVLSMLLLLTEAAPRMLQMQDRTVRTI
jgi:hypothetical protein